LKWKADWETAKANLIEWWGRKGLALCLMSPRRVALEQLSKPAAPADVTSRWLDADYRRRCAEYEMVNTCYFAEAFPYFDVYVGPGSTATFLGSEPHFAPNTVWYEPCISDPAGCGPIRFDPAGKWFQAHLAITQEGLSRADGRYIVGIPDLVENLDILAAMRGNEELLMDLIERPTWIAGKLEEINQAYFEAFDALYKLIRADGGNVYCAFRIWGPGKTAKVQCDISCMISPQAFNELCLPPLREQCRWLDYSMYHLDGEEALGHLDSLLSIDELDAIEWTPNTHRPSGGSGEWYGLYKRIKQAGKSVQAIDVRPDEVIPLLDAVGPEGMFLHVWADDEETAGKLLEKTEQYR